MSKPKDLERFPRPGVTVDLAILTVTGTPDSFELRVLIQDHEELHGRGLPGGFIRERRTVAETVADVLGRKCGVVLSPDDARPRLLQVFDEPARDSRTWALSIGHSLALQEPAALRAHGDLVRVLPDGRLEGEGTLLFDHDQIVAAAITDVRARYEVRRRYIDVHPDPDGFLPEPFTLHQLRMVHEAVVGEPLHKDNFNRRMKPLLKPVLHKGEPVLATALRGRPAALYRKANTS